MVLQNRATCRDVPLVCWSNALIFNRNVPKVKIVGKSQPLTAIRIAVFQSPALKFLSPVASFSEHQGKILMQNYLEIYS